MVEIKGLSTLYTHIFSQSGGPLVLLRGRRPKSVVAAADASHFRAGRAANDVILRDVDASLRQRYERRPVRNNSPSFKHSKAAIHVPPRTAHRLKHPVHLVRTAAVRLHCVTLCWSVWCRTSHNRASLRFCVCALHIKYPLLMVTGHL